MNRSRGHSLQNQTSSIWCVEGSSLPLLQDTLNGCETPRTDRPLPNPPKSSAVIKPSDVAILIRRLYQVRLSLKNDDVACGVNNYCLLSASLRTFVCYASESCPQIWRQTWPERTFVDFLGRDSVRFSSSPYSEFILLLHHRCSLLQIVESQVWSLIKKGRS